MSLIEDDVEELTIPSGWSVKELRELAEPERGITYGIVQPGHHVADGVPIIRVQNIGNGTVETDDLMRVSPRITASYSRTCLRGGELLLSLVGSVGSAAIAPPEVAGWNTARAVAVVPLLPEYDARWVRFCLRSKPLQHLMEVWCNTTVQATLNLKDVHRLPIPLPPKHERDAMVETLSAIDDKIELNRQMNRTLEETAGALFGAWLDKHESSICSASVETLIAEDVLLIGDGYRAKNSEMGADGIPFVRAGNLRESGIDLAEADKLVPRSVAAAGLKIGMTGDVAFTSKGTVGRLTRVSSETGPFVYSPQVCFWRVLNSKRLHPNVLYRWMKTDEFHDQVAMVSGQTDMAPYVSLRDQRRMEINLPAAEFQAEIGMQLALFDDLIAANGEESQTLATLRDTLLPKLLSGEVRVKEVKTSG